MTIGITLNEVLRDNITQFQYTYNKYIALTGTDEIDTDYKTAELLEIENIKFKTMEELNRFLYMEAPLEIFGHADQMHENLASKVNEFIIDIEDEEEHELLLIGVEHDKSIPATNFFLSKTGMRFRNVKFVKKEKEVWEDIDLLITANPRLIELKPDNKKIVKINHPYNTDLKVDHNYDTIMDFINDSNILNTLTNGE